ncbi:MAG: TolC family protein [Deltaproteobacteria bacterium]|nr:TolC family protein [Deltaproteobacteria bacterium]
MLTDARTISYAYALLLTGCISTGIRDDLTLVRDLSAAADLPEVAGPVQDSPTEIVDGILGQPLDADSAVRVAMLNNRELRASLRELGIARSRVLTAGLLPNPSFDLEFNPERQTGLEIRVEWDVAGLVLAPLRAEAAGADLDAARFDLAGHVIATGYRVRSSFYDMQAAQERLELMERSLDASAAARDAARALAAAGNLRALDLSAREAEYEEERVKVAEAALSAVVAREDVQRLLGLHGDAMAWTIQGRLPEAPLDRSALDDVERSALDASLELRAMRSQMTAAARRAGLARVEGVLPEILVDVHALVGDPAAPDALAIGGGVGVRLPLFDRGDGRVAEYEHELDAAFERYVGAAIDVRSEARTARARFTSSAERVRHYREVVLPARQRVLDETLLQYNAMQVSIFELLEALRERQRAELDAIDTRAEHMRSAALLDALLAGHRGAASQGEP